MKKWKNIFIGFSVLALLVMPVVAAENGCDNDDNDMIVAELALCSTHAYNIGNTKNPSGADKGLMRDVIAMKTTVITQQMYKQYEQMESMLRRLKTQLEKAILTTSLEAKGASSGSSGGSSSSSGGSYKSDDKYRVLAATENCMQKGSLDSAVSCIQSNVRIVMNAVDSGDTTNARKQLEKDLEVAKTWGIIDGNTGDYSRKGESTSKLKSCNDMTKTEDPVRKKATVQACSNELNVQIGLFLDTRAREARQQDKR